MITTILAPPSASIAGLSIKCANISWAADLTIAATVLTSSSALVASERVTGAKVSRIIRAARVAGLDSARVADLVDWIARGACAADVPWAAGLAVTATFLTRILEEVAGVSWKAGALTRVLAAADVAAWVTGFATLHTDVVFFRGFREVVGELAAISRDAAMRGVGTAALSWQAALARSLALASTGASAGAGVGIVESIMARARTRTRAGPAVLLVDDAVGVGGGEGLLALLEETTTFGGVLGPGTTTAGLPGGSGGGVGGEDGQQTEGEEEDVAAIEDHSGGRRVDFLTTATIPEKEVDTGKSRIRIESNVHLLAGTCVMREHTVRKSREERTMVRTHGVGRRGTCVRWDERMTNMPIQVLRSTNCSSTFSPGAKPTKIPIDRCRPRHAGANGACQNMPRHSKQDMRRK